MISSTAIKLNISNFHGMKQSDKLKRINLDGLSLLK